MNILFSGLYWVFQVSFYCRRWCELYGGLVEEEEETENIIHSTKLPWLWVGAEEENGKIITVTDIVNKRVRSGMCVDALYLKQITNLQPKRWLYLNSITLSEDEFPSTGIVIE